MHGSQFTVYVNIVTVHAFILLVYTKTVPTIGIAGMYVQDKGIFWIME